MRSLGFALSLFISLPFSFFARFLVALRHLYTQRTTARYDYCSTTKTKNAITNDEGDKRYTLCSHHIIITHIRQRFFPLPLSLLLMFDDNGSNFFISFIFLIFPPKDSSSAFPAPRLPLLPPPIITFPIAFTWTKSLDYYCMYITLACSTYLLGLDTFFACLHFSFSPVFYFPPHVYYYYYYYMTSTG